MGAGSTRHPIRELTLEQLLAEPIVQQLMRRDRIDEATIRDLLRQTAAARAASQPEDDPGTDDRNATEQEDLCRSTV